MQYTTLGTSTLRISRLAFGCMSLNSHDPNSIHLLQQALDGGINFFDTADLYDKGANETLVGTAFKHKRNQVIIATKVGNQWRPDGSGWDWNPRKEYIVKAVDESLRRLQTNYIDLYQLHGGTINDPIEETIEAFELLQQQGKIRFYGISSIRPNVIREWVQRSGMVSVMMQYSLLDRRPEETCLPLLQQHNIGVLARGSVAQGLLLGKPPKEYLNYTAADVAKAAEAVRSASDNKRSATATALQFVWRHKAIAAAVVGLRTEEQLKEALTAVTAPPLSDDEYAALQAVLPPNVYEQHR